MSDRSAPHLRNRSPSRNRISPCATETFLRHRPGEGQYIDPYFGYSWDFAVNEGNAVYGITEDFASSSPEILGSGDFVRVPYRRIPRVIIRSLDEFSAFIRACGNQKSDVSLMWRGQAREYDLPRSNSDKLKLYGDVKAREPSLLPSASRGTVKFEDYMEVWFGLLDIYISERLKKLSGLYAPSVTDQLKAEAEEWRNSYRFKYWAFAAAQHYGLPSTGLDLTTSPSVALFFALHSFTTGSGGQVDITRVSATQEPIVYILGIQEDDLLPDEKLGPSWIQTKRARAQHAHFFGSAWGERSNRAAERILCVLELKGHATWQIPHQTPELFPPRSDDLFCDYLLAARRRFPTIADRVPLDRVYHWA